jgi:hypothetical protein
LTLLERKIMKIRFHEFPHEVSRTRRDVWFLEEGQKRSNVSFEHARNIALFQKRGESAMTLLGGGKQGTTTVLIWRR